MNFIHSPAGYKNNQPVLKPVCMKKFVCIAFPLLAFLHSYGQQKQLVLDSVTVTAAKFEQKQSETGKVVNIITQEELKRDAGQTLGQILNEQPGIIINGTGETLGSDLFVYMRGASDQYTMILINGIPVYDPSQISSYFDLNLVPVSMIERIEIIRGGASTMYGSGAIAGVINIITKNSGGKPFSVTAGINAGSYHTFEEQAGVNGETSKINYAINFDQLDSKGISSALDTTGKADFDDDGFHRKEVNATVGIHFTPLLLIKPFLMYTHEEGGLDEGAFVDAKNYTYTTDNLQTGLQASYQLAKKGSIHLNYSYNDVHRNYLDDTIVDPDYLKELNTSFVQDAEIYLEDNLSSQWQLLAGTDYRFNKVNETSLSISSYGPYESDLSGDSTHMNMGSAYASVFFKSPGGFHFEAGGRLNHHSLYGNNATFTLNPFYLIHNRYKIFADVSSGFNAPSLYQLFAPYYGNTSLQPEKSVNYQAGTELPFSNKFSLRITGFVTHIRHVIEFTDKYVNFDQEHTEGGEAEVTYRPVTALKLSGYYSFVTGKIITQSSFTNADTTYNNLYKRPENSFGIYAGYQVLPSLYVGAQLQYVGKRMDIYFNDLTYSQENLWLKSYALLNVLIQYNWKQKISLFIDFKNITDTHYVETTGFATMGFNFTTGINFSL
jgi:vitamin B12 transporter